MHIIINGINLTRIEFELYPQNVENLHFDMHVTCDSSFPDAATLVQEITFNLMHKVENPPFKLIFTYQSTFQSAGDGEPSLEEFARSFAPAYVMPYARELISNITGRAEGIIPPLLLPPINIFDLIEKGRLESSQSDGFQNLQLPLDNAGQDSKAE